MEITHDRNHITQVEQELVSRGYASEGLYSLRFSYAPTEEQKAASRARADAVGMGSDAWNAYITADAQRRSGHMERIAAALAQNLRIYQYGDQDEVPYGSDWDLFFWCNDFSQTMQGLLAGRDYRYFTLSFNGKHGPERRQEVYGRAMRVLDLFANDADLDVAVQYEAVMDEDKARRDAALAIPGLAGRKCVYNGMEGRLETNGEVLFFRKKRSRKRIYKLTDAEVLGLSWRLTA